MPFNPITDLPNDCVVLDTETTGFDPQEGDRIVEIGAVRMRDGLPTGEHFHVYINPERTVPQPAVDVHGLDDAFLADKPVFAAVAADFLEFLGERPFVAHNAPFDLKFLNAELERAGHAPIAAERVYDSVTVARRLFPGAQANLDALCRRFKIPLTGRGKHGALIDSELLADVLVEMGGGRQQTLFAPTTTATEAHTNQARFEGPRPPALDIDAATLHAHQDFVATELGPQSIWAQIYAKDALASNPETEAA